MNITCERFTWFSQNEIISFDILNIPQERNGDYIFEVDIQQPTTEKLHEILSDLSFLVKNYSSKSNSKISKLITNVSNKDKYVVHYKNL